MKNNPGHAHSRKRHGLRSFWQNGTCIGTCIVHVHVAKRKKRVPLGKRLACFAPFILLVPTTWFWIQTIHFIQCAHLWDMLLEAECIGNVGEPGLSKGSERQTIVFFYINWQQNSNNLWHRRTWGLSLSYFFLPRSLTTHPYTKNCSQNSSIPIKDRRSCGSICVGGLNDNKQVDAFLSIYLARI